MDSSRSGYKMSLAFLLDTPTVTTSVLAGGSSFESKGKSSNKDDQVESVSHYHSLLTILCFPKPHGQTQWDTRTRAGNSKTRIFFGSSHAFSKVVSVTRFALSFTTRTNAFRTPDNSDTIKSRNVNGESKSGGF